MKIFLDDKRELLASHELLTGLFREWVLVRTYGVALELLRWNMDTIQAVSCDHDLGTVTTGYDFIVEIERLAHERKRWIPPHVSVHTSNPSARIKMQQAADKINALREERLDALWIEEK